MPTGAARDGREVMGAPVPIFLEGRADPVQRLAMRQKGREALEVVEVNRHIMHTPGHDGGALLGRRVGPAGSGAL